MYKIDSLGTGDDYNDPLAWSYAAGMLIEALSRHIKKKIVVQAHEWLSGGAILYLKSRNLNIPTVFTTHATVLGRAIAYSGTDIFDFLRANTSIDQSIPYKYGVSAKHFTEKAGAFNADIFTTVSDVVAKEAQTILGKAPDIITVNGIDVSSLPDLDEVNNMRQNAYNKFISFVNSYFIPYYDLDTKNSKIFFTSGRYEFFDKGFDLFIDALGRLNKILPDSRSVIVLIAVPSGTMGLKPEVVANYLTYISIKSQIEQDVRKFDEVVLSSQLNNKDLDKVYSKIINDSRLLISQLRRPRPTNPPICPFILSYPEYEDAIISKLKENGLDNSKENNVKVIFYPKYLSVGDELLNLTYNEVQSVADAGFFLSRYEPFGYTPLEAASYLSLAFTTDHAGFGAYLTKMRLENQGIYVEKLIGKTRDQIINQIANDMLKVVLLDPDDLFKLRINARKTVENFDWNSLFNNYLKAYDLAIKKH